VNLWLTVDDVDLSQGPDGAAAAKKKRPRGGPAAGYEGEDVVHGAAADGPLKLQLPQRFAEGTWMAAAWRVLAGIGPEGMHIDDVSAVYGDVFMCCMCQAVVC
jgi:hypothetical protein